MQKIFLRYSQGDIVVLELPFTDLVGSKLRPVLVLNAIDLGEDIVVAKITSKEKRLVLKIVARLNQDALNRVKDEIRRIFAL